MGKTVTLRNPSGRVVYVPVEWFLAEKKSLCRDRFILLDAPQEIEILPFTQIGDEMGRSRGRVERQHAAEKAHIEGQKTKPKIGADGVPPERIAPLPMGKCLVRVVSSRYHRSGQWVFVLEMLGWTAGAGIETHLVCKGEPGDIAAIEGVAIHYCDSPDEAEKIVKGLNPALIHSHSPAKEWGIPQDFDRSRLVGTEHGSFDRNVTPQKPWIVPIVGRPDSVWHGVDLEQFHPPKRHRRGKMFRIGISGRIDATKYPDSFLEMLKESPLEGVQWTILGDVIGPDGQRSDVAERLKAIRGINFKGWVDRADMPGELRKLDALCVPSSQECCPIAAIEGMACGLPVIARNVSGLPDVVGEGGILCSDDGAIFEAIQQLRDDKKRWLTLCKKARAWAVKRFDKRTELDRYKGTYQERGGLIEFKEPRPKSEPVPEKPKLIKISGRKPRVILAIDREGWAFHNIALQLKKRLCDEFNFTITPYHKLEDMAGDLGVFFWWDAATKYGLNLKNKLLCLYDTFDAGQYKAWKDLPHFVELAGKSCGIIAANDAIATLAKERTNTPVFVCEDGVDVDMFPKLPLPPRFCVGWTGSDVVAPGNKGIDLIMEACVGLRIPMHFHGRESGMIGHADMSRGFYQHISCYVCASEKEGTPNPVLEALSSGRPVVSTDVGIVNKVINAGNGVIVERTVADIQRGLLQIQANGAAHYADAARKAAESFSWEVKTENWRTALRSVFE